MKKALWCYLLKRRKLYLDTTVICTAAKTVGIDMFNSSTLEAIKVVEHLREELKKHYRNNKTRRDEYLLSKANLESEAGDEGKAKAIRKIKKLKDATNATAPSNSIKDQEYRHKKSTKYKYPNYGRQWQSTKKMMNLSG